jgi:GNAT superfamily N-acetyltransferase
VVVTAWGDEWGCDPIVVPGVSDDVLPEMWSTAMRTIDDLGLRSVETLVPDDDQQLRDLVMRAGFEPTGERSGVMWTNADERRPTPAMPAGFMLVDRTRTAGTPHPMVQRNGPAVEERLKQCSLYDPALDLAVVTDDGHVAGYALFWFDPVTTVGLVEPVRVEEPYWRRGLARAMVLHGLDRLAHRGARRMKVGYTSDAAGALYLSCGFRDATAAHAFRRLRTD